MYNQIAINDERVKSPQSIANVIAVVGSKRYSGHSVRFHRLPSETVSRDSSLPYLQGLKVSRSQSKVLDSKSCGSHQRTSTADALHWTLSASSSSLHLPYPRYSPANNRTIKYAVEPKKRKTVIRTLHERHRKKLTRKPSHSTNRQLDVDNV